MILNRGIVEGVNASSSIPAFDSCCPAFPFFPLLETCQLAFEYVVFLLHVVLLLLELLTLFLKVGYPRIQSFDFVE